MRGIGYAILSVAMLVAGALCLHAQTAMPLLGVGVGAGGGGGGGGGGGSITFTKTGNPAVNNEGFAHTSSTFTSVGVAPGLVLIGVSNSQATTVGGVTSVTVDTGGGPVGATKTIGDGVGDTSSLWQVVIASGTSATIVVSCGACNSSAFSIVGIVVGVITNYNSTTPTATGVHAADFAAEPILIPASGTVTVGASSIAVITMMAYAAGTAVWSNATADYSTSGSGNTVVLAHATAAGNFAYSESGSGGFSGAGTAGVVAVWH